MASHTQDFSRYRRFIFSLAGYILLALGVYALALDHPVFMHPDFTTIEEIYRDCVQGTGSLTQWHLPRSSYYLDIALYCIVRSVGGSIQQGLALFAAVQACLLVGSIHFSLGIASALRCWTVPLAALIFVLITHGSDELSTWMLVSMAHNITMAAAIFCFGLFVRVVAGHGRMGPLAMSVMVFTLCDFMFVLWFMLLVLTLLGIRFLTHPEKRRICLLQGALLCGAILLGKVMDTLLRAYPAARQGSPKLRYVPHSFQILFEELSRLSTVMPFYGPLWIIGLIVLICGSFSKEKGIQTLSRLTLLSALINVGVLSLYNMTGYYCIVFFYFPILIGIPLCIFMLKPERLHRLVPALSATGLVCFLAWHAATDLKNPRGPLYPPVAQCLDRFMKTHSDRIFLANYWSAHDRFFAQTEEVSDMRVSLLFPHTLIPYHINTNPSTSLENATAVLIVDIPDYGRIEPEQVRRLHGEPKEEFICTEYNGASRIWVYDKPVRPATPADLLFNARMAPEFSSKDTVLWEGTHTINESIRLVRVTTALRWDERWCVLEFASSAESLQDQQFIASFIGNRSPSHRRKAAAWLMENPDSILASLYCTLLHNKSVTVGPSNTHALPNGNTAVFFSIPSRHSKQWPLFDIVHGEERFSLIPYQ